MIAVATNLLVYAHRGDSAWHDAAYPRLAEWADGNSPCISAAGPMVHDARVAAVCLIHGVGELWTADRYFGRFRGLNVRNPLIEA